MRIIVNKLILKDYRGDFWEKVGITPGLECMTSGLVRINYLLDEKGYPVFIDGSIYYIPEKYCEVIER